MSSIRLSVVIPCFEEMGNLQKGVLQKVQSFFEAKKFPYEVIIVDDGSQDGSVAYIEDFIKSHKSFRLIKNPHMGKAGAVTSGVLASKGELVLFTDMDQATPIEEVEKLLPYFEQKYDVVIGSRSSKRQGAPLIRQLVSIGNILLRKIIVGITDISDTQCGFKMFRHDTANTLFTQIREIHHGFRNIHGSSVTSGFDVELLYLAEQAGYKIKEVPVRWLYVETRRVSPVKDSIDGVKELMKIRMNIMQSMYKK